MMYPSPFRPAALAVALLAGLPAGVLAQPDSGAPSAPVAPSDTPPATPPATPSTDAGSAREALKKKDTDVDQATLLKETLTSAEKQYSLLKAGKLQTTYDLTYTFIGSQTLTGTPTQFDLENVRSHTITNSVSIDYGLFDNLTGSVVLPLVSKFTQTNTFTGLTNDFGDISLGGRWQPFSLKRDGPTVSITGNFKLPTGRSPFATVQGHDLATGQGYRSATVGLNVSKIVDPAALFGSVNFTLADGANHIYQPDQEDPATGHILVGIKPGPSIGVGGGFAYSLSYDLSTTMSFQETLSLPSRLLYVPKAAPTSNPTTAHTQQQVTGILSMGLGVRMSPKTTINVNLGVGLTTDSPDFTFGMNMPLNFGTLF
jgi:hypothetical protein